MARQARLGQTVGQHLSARLSQNWLTWPAELELELAHLVEEFRFVRFGGVSALRRAGPSRKLAQLAVETLEDMQPVDGQIERAPLVVLDYGAAVRVVALVAPPQVAGLAPASPHLAPGTRLEPAQR